MSREAALLGALAYTTFSGRLAAVDSELIRRGWLRDLRDGRLVLRKRDHDAVHARRENGLALVGAVQTAISQVA
jgi:predicted glycosyltransferase